MVLSCQEMHLTLRRCIHQPQLHLAQDPGQTCMGNTVRRHLGRLVSRANKECRTSVAAGDDGAWEAKLADFGLHATVEAMDRNKCALPDGGLGFRV